MGETFYHPGHGLHNRGNCCWLRGLDTKTIAVQVPCVYVDYCTFDPGATYVYSDPKLSHEQQG